MSNALVKTLKIKLVAAELRDLGVTDQSTVLAIAARTTVLDNGAIGGLTADGSTGVGNGHGAHLSVADVVNEMRVNVPTSVHPAAAVQGNPFRPGKDYSLTGQMILMRTDPVLAEDLAAEAGVSLRRTQ